MPVLGWSVGTCSLSERFKFTSRCLCPMLLSRWLTLSCRSKGDSLCSERFKPVEVPLILHTVKLVDISEPKQWQVPVFRKVHKRVELPPIQYIVKSFDIFVLKQ